MRTNYYVKKKKPKWNTEKKSILKNHSDQHEYILEGHLKREKICEHAT